MPLLPRLDGQLFFEGAQCQGMSSSTLFSIQPFTRRISTSAKLRCGSTPFILQVSTSEAMQAWGLDSITLSR